MWCNKCGKEIADQAKFCNHCGAMLNNTQPRSASAPQASPQEKPAEKKETNMVATIIIALIVALIVYFLVRGITKSGISETPSASGAIPVSQGSSEVNSETHSASGTIPVSQESSDVNADVSIAMSSCMYGGLYQNGTLQYGMTKLTAPGYSLLPGEGDERDWLISEYGTYLLSAYKQNEIMGVSYNATTEQALLGSYINAYGSAEMTDFRKMEVNGFPVIRYTVYYTDSGIYVCEGGFIVFPSETAKETIRLAMFADIAGGGVDAEIDRVLDTLQVSTDFALTFEDTQTMGLNRITVK